TLLELETDKATIEVPSPAAGTVKTVHVKDGDKVTVGQKVIDFSDVTPAVQESPIAEPQAVDAVEESRVSDSHVASQMRDAAAKQEEPRTEEPQHGSIPTPYGLERSVKMAPAAPSVRRFAREIGVDIHQITGSGPRGRISIDDVKKFSRARSKEKE